MHHQALLLKLLRTDTFTYPEIDTLLKLVTVACLCSLHSLSHIVSKALKRDFDANHSFRLRMIHHSANTGGNLDSTNRPRLEKYLSFIQGLSHPPEESTEINNSSSLFGS